MYLTSLSGQNIDLFEPQVKDFKLSDIVIGLSNECRLGGQMHRDYKVAQHSMLVAWLMMQDGYREYALYGLLHDAPEAYLKDIPTPLKVVMKEYQKIEERFLNCILQSFNLEYDYYVMEELIHDYYDKLALKIEKENFTNHNEKWGLSRFDDIDIPIINPMPAVVAREKYATFFNLLCSRHYEFAKLIDPSYIDVDNRCWAKNLEVNSVGC